MAAPIMFQSELECVNVQKNFPEGGCPGSPKQMGLAPILIQQGEFSERQTNNAERETKSPKQAKTNRSAIQANKRYLALRLA